MHTVKICSQLHASESAGSKIWHSAYPELQPPETFCVCTFDEYFCVDKADNSCLFFILDFTANACDWTKGYIPQTILILKQEQSVSEELKPKIMIENPVGRKSC